jgi:hypothetical protein
MYFTLNQRFFYGSFRKTTAIIDGTSGYFSSLVPEDISIDVKNHSKRNTPFSQKCPYFVANQFKHLYSLSSSIHDAGHLLETNEIKKIISL